MGCQQFPVSISDLQAETRQEKFVLPMSLIVNDLNNVAWKQHQTCTFCLISRQDTLSWVREQVQPWEMSDLASSQITQSVLLHKAFSVYLDLKCQLVLPLWALFYLTFAATLDLGVSLSNPHACMWVMVREAQMVKESQPVPKRCVTSNTSPRDPRCLFSLRFGPLWSVWKGTVPGPRHAVSSSLT